MNPGLIPDYAAINDNFIKDTMALIQWQWQRLNNRIRDFDVAEIKFIVRGKQLNEVMKQYFGADYEDDSIFVEVRAFRTDMPHMDGYNPLSEPNFYDVENVTFYIFNEPVYPLFENGEAMVVDDDTQMPVLSEILHECYVQKTANPVMKLKE